MTANHKLLYFYIVISTFLLCHSTCFASHTYSIDSPVTATSDTSWPLLMWARSLFWSVCRKMPHRGTMRTSTVSHHLNVGLRTCSNEVRSGITISFISTSYCILMPALFISWVREAMASTCGNRYSIARVSQPLAGSLELRPSWSVRLSKICL